MTKRQRTRTRDWPGTPSGDPHPAPTDPDGRFIALRGGQVFVVEDEVDDERLPPVLTVHGIPGSTRDWRYLGPAMAAHGQKCARLDLPGFARSELSSWDAYEPRNRAAFFPWMADALELDRFVLMAHSFGGGLALTAAAMFPDRVCGLVLVNSVGTIRHRGLAPIQGRLLKGLPDLLHHDVLGGPLLELTRAGYKKLGFKGNSWEGDVELEGFSDREIEHHIRVVQHMDFAEHRWAAREVRCPTLVISTDDDPLIEARVPHRLVTDLGAGALRRHLHLPDGGHYANKHHAHAIADEMATLFA